MTREEVVSRPRQLLERNRELAEVDTCIAAAKAEQGSFLVLEGRAGMGKSALLAEVQRRAAAAGFAICLARASELETDFAFGIVRQLFEPAVAALGREQRARALEGAAAMAQRVLDVGDGPAVPEQFAALHGLYWLAANLAARTPLLLAVDDGHWADVASLRWLAYLLNRLEGLPVLVAIATRPPPSGPQGEVLAAILAQSWVRILPVGPLREGSVAALVRSTLGVDPDPTFTAACLRVTAGNPLGLNELLRELRTSGVGPTRAAAAGLASRAPDALTRRVHRDLTLLGEDAERLARALAVIGDETELRLISKLADLEMDRAVEATDALLSADLIAPEHPPRFAHALLRAAVYERLPAGIRHTLHRRAAHILASEGAEPEVVAAHLLRCEAGRSPETIRWLRAAAPPALRRGAPEVAISYLRRAVAEDADVATRAALLADLGRAELVTGDLAAAGHLRQALAGSTEPQARAAVLGDLALAVILMSDESAGRGLLREALDYLRRYDADVAGRLECSEIVMSTSDPRGASSHESFYPRLRQLATGNTSSAEVARVTLATFLSLYDGNGEEAANWVGGGFDWKLLFDGGPLHSIIISCSMLALLALDDLHRAAVWCETVIREAAAEGYLITVLIAMVFKAYAELRMGLLAEAEADAAAALEMSRQHSPYWTPAGGAFLADILFERGRQQAAYEVIDGIGPEVANALMKAHVLEVRGRLHYARGSRQRGVEDLRASGSLCEVMRLRNPIFWSWRTTLATALVQDSPDEARELARDHLAIARHSGVPRAIGVALRTLAPLYEDDAIDLLRAAIVEFEKSPAPLDLCRALTDLGAGLRHRGHRVEAREPLQEALEIATRCGAVPLMERAQAEAIAAGARPRRPRRRGVDALTPSELRVARLAAEGRSNREIAQALFITTKTVADHLGSSYSKLGITSREKLATALELSPP